MLYPSTADSGAYEVFGKACAEHFLAGNFMACYNGLRPLGILSYFALPFMAATDPVTITYITLLMNLICLGVLMYACWSLWANLSRPEPPLGPAHADGVSWPRRLLGGCLLLLILVQTVGYVPLRLADIQGVALFMAGIAVAAASNKLVTKTSAAVIGGMLAGAAVLFRQNYVIPLAVVAGLWFIIGAVNRSRPVMASAIWFGVGGSVCLIQAIWVYLHSGVPWFYEPHLLAQYAESTRQPYIELLAFSLPSAGSAYASSLAHPVSDFAFVATKFYHGLFKFYWTPSLGHAPVDYTPPRLDYTAGDFIRFQAIFILMGMLAVASFFLRRPWLALAVMSAFIMAAASAVMSLTEYRYFLYARLVYIVYGFYALSMLGAWWMRHHRAE